MQLNVEKKIKQITWDFGQTTGIGRVVYELHTRLMSRGWNAFVLANQIAKTEVQSECVQKIDGLSDVRGNRFFNRLADVLSILKFIFLINKNKELGGVLTISHFCMLRTHIMVGHSCHRNAIRVKMQSKNYWWLLNPIHYIILLNEYLFYKFGNFRFLVCISNSEKEIFLNNYKIDDNKIKVIPNGVDRNVFSPIYNVPELKRSFNIENDCRIILFVGNEIERKGLPILIEAFKKVESAGVDAKLVIIGNLKKRTVTELLSKHGVTKQSIFLGPVSDVAKWMAAADALVLLSDYEPFGLVGIEAIAAGTPVVCTEVGGMIDYIKLNENGVFVERNSESVASGIMVCFSMFDKTSECVDKIRLTSARYDWKIVVKEYESLFFEIME